MNDGTYLIQYPDGSSIELLLDEAGIASLLLEAWVSQYKVRVYKVLN